jgi:hypothetical protein
MVHYPEFQDKVCQDLGKPVRTTRAPHSHGAIRHAIYEEHTITREFYINNMIISPPSLSLSLSLSLSHTHIHTHTHTPHRASPLKLSKCQRLGAKTVF